MKQNAFDLFMLFLTMFCIIRGVNFAIVQQPDLSIVHAMFAIVFSILNRRTE